ncbi:MAG: hypothetical protein ABEH90_04720 [Halolamina sp.]
MAPLGDDDQNRRNILKLAALLPAVLEASKGDAPGNQTGIARCRSGSSDELRVSGGSSTYPETITFYDADTGEKLGSTDATYNPETTVGMYDWSKVVSELPDSVRAINTNSSEATAEVQ